MLHLRPECSHVLVALCLVFSSGQAAAQSSARPILHPLFADHMVLERGVRVPIWGWAASGDDVRVRFAGQDKQARAAVDGRWTVWLDPLEASATGRDLVVVVTPPASGTRPPVQLHVSDVVVGDVWLCSGQSNMEFAVKSARGGDAEVASANEPDVRIFTTATSTAASPRAVPPDGFVSWQRATPDTVADFSAVGYFFGRKLRSELGVPIGLINSSWGGTPVESWTSAGALAAAPASASKAVDLAADTLAWNIRFHQRADDLVDAWFAAHDPGSVGDLNADPRLDESSWTEVATGDRGWPGEKLASGVRLAWFRRAVDVPAAWAGHDLTLSLGPLTTEDTTWFNGQRVGQALVPWDGRVYTIPGALVRPGRTVVAVRVVCTGKDCGFSGGTTDQYLQLNPDTRLSLAGSWRAKAGPTPVALGRKPYRVAADPWVPASLYNAKIAPLLPFAIKGVIWYQGEQNTNDAGHYAALLTSMIGDWRQRFDVPALPFGIVQLANFGDRHPAPTDSDWAHLRDAQRLVTMRVPHTGLVVTTDIGDAVNIHPANKQDVGLRLAGWALATVYGKSREWSGPLLRATAVDGGRLRLSFDHVGGGLRATGERLSGFTVAGTDRRFVPAEATIDGSDIVVWSADVSHPVAARYAFDDDPVGNLANADGLPASPFKTDSWQAAR